MSRRGRRKKVAHGASRGEEPAKLKSPRGAKEGRARLSSRPCSFAPRGLFNFAGSSPRLAPWATFCRRPRLIAFSCPNCQLPSAYCLSVAVRRPAQKRHSGEGARRGKVGESRAGAAARALRRGAAEGARGVGLARTGRGAGARANERKSINPDPKEKRSDHEEARHHISTRSVPRPRRRLGLRREEAERQQLDGRRRGHDRFGAEEAPQAPQAPPPPSPRGRRGQRERQQVRGGRPKSARTPLRGGGSTRGMVSATCGARGAGGRQCQGGPARAALKGMRGPWEDGRLPHPYFFTSALF